jgi:hypothetical protein
MEEVVGSILNNMMAAMGLEREQVYMANIVKCRPPANPDQVHHLLLFSISGTISSSSGSIELRDH